MGQVGVVFGWVLDWQEKPWQQWRWQVLYLILVQAGRADDGLVQQSKLFWKCAISFSLGCVSELHEHNPNRFLDGMALCHPATYD
jgi:hypothetical protein